MLLSRLSGRSSIAAVCMLTLFLFAGDVCAQSAGSPTSFKVEVSGRGPAMILIPGLGTSGDVWRSTVEHYRDRFECHVLTLAGFAGAPPIEPALVATARQELAAYIGGRQLARPVIVGHSLGGTLALAVAADHPDLTGPLVIVDSLPFLGGVMFGVNSAAEAAPQIAMIRSGMAAMSPAQFEQIVQSGAITRVMTTGDANHDLVRTWMAKSDVKTVANAMADVYGMDLRADLPRIDSPALVLGTWVGVREQLAAMGSTITRDAVAANFNAQFANLRGARVVMSDTSRHFIMLDEPEWMFGEIDRFLAR